MDIPWSTGATRTVWVNGNVDSSGLWEGLRMWSDRCGIVYTPAAALGEAQIVAVDPDEYTAAFGVSGFVGHSTTITDAAGYGVICYVTLRDDTGPNWQRDAAWAHEAGHAEGEVDIVGAADSIYSYADVHDEPSQSDTAAWIARFGPNEAGTAFHAGDGSGGGILGGGGDDTIWGDGGDDIVYGNRGADRLDGGTGADTLYGGQGADTVSGGEGDDVLYGNLGADRLEANGGNDTLYGGQDADTLVGGDGANLLVGGLGPDRYEADGDDTIFGFDPSVDTLVVIGGTAPVFMGPAFGMPALQLLAQPPVTAAEYFA